MSLKCPAATDCNWPDCQCGESVYPWAAAKHGIARREWERRFTERFAACAVSGDDNQKLTGDALVEIVENELEAWPAEGDPHNGPDWMATLPEEAADEQMSNWLQDQEP